MRTRRRNETADEFAENLKNLHYASDFKTNGPKFAFAPKVGRMNYLQDVSDNENDYAEEEQNNNVGND